MPADEVPTADPTGPADAAELTGAVLDVLATRGVPVVRLSRAGGLPLVELLVPRRQASLAWSLVGQLPYRWRFGGDGIRRVVRRRAWVFDSGVRIVVHARLPGAGLPQSGARRLEREAWARARARQDAGVDPVLVALYTLVQADRRARRDVAEQREVRAAVHACDRDELRATADRVGARPALERMVDERDVTAPAGRGSGHGRWREAALRRAPVPARALLQGDPWTAAVARVRFSGLELLAGPGTFLPRAESEQLVERCLDDTSPPRTVAEAGTGCGAVALALAARVPGVRVVAVEIDPKPLRWARLNVRRLRCAGVDFRRGSLLDPVMEPAMESLHGTLDVVVGNLPFLLPDVLPSAADAPGSAYLGTGGDGLDLQRALACQAARVLRPGGRLLLQLPPDAWLRLVPDLVEAGFTSPVAFRSHTAVVGQVTWPGPPLI
jgi:methylase of polypeptide subunit release factors